MTSPTTAKDLRIRARGYRDLASHLEPSGVRESMLEAADALDAKADEQDRIIAEAERRIAALRKEKPAAG